MTVKQRPVAARLVHQSTSGTRLTIDVTADALEALAAWARFDGRSIEGQARFLIEQAALARGSRLALTRR